MRCCLTTLVIIVVVVAVVAGGGFLYLKGPEMRAVATYLPSVSWEGIRDNIPFLRPTHGAPLPLSPEQQSHRDTLLAAEKRSRPSGEREAAVLKQLQATGLPVTGVWIVETAKGEPNMTIGLDYERMGSGSDPGRALAEGVRAFASAVQAKSVDFSGMTYVTMAVRDDAGRVVVAMTGTTPDIEAFRSGKITQKQFLAKTAAQIQSKEAAVDLVWKLVQQ
ncbi:MAG: hypothetical protein M1401_13340 [Chloroflexi bacterium]|nr:hypothetical protein [Chloroflexota bacterium]